MTTKITWQGGEDILIQTGDMIDRGPSSRGTVFLLRELQKEAPAVGGDVVRFCGNHELMLLQGNSHYADFSDPDSLQRELKEEMVAGKLRDAYLEIRPLWDLRFAGHSPARLGLICLFAREFYC